MYELIQVSDYSYYIDSPAKIGLVKLGEGEVCLIDSGNDKDAGKKVFQILRSNNWQLRAIYNTHSHADHIGANKYLQKQTGCKIYAPGIECSFTSHPILEPSFLYGGCPPKDLRHKFLLAEESRAEYLTDDALPCGFEIIDLPGHFYTMAGFRTPDGVVYLADALCNKKTLDKYKISFLYDVGAYLDTLEKIKNMSAKVFVPSHADPVSDISELCDYNIRSVHMTAERILDICSLPLCFENILERLFNEYSLNMNFEQYVLVGSTVRSYLSYLKDSGKINADFKNNMLLWERV